MLINDDDGDVALPSSLDDRYIQPHGFTRQPRHQPPYTGFAATIQAARLYPHVHRTLRSGVVTTQSIQTIDEMSHSTLLLFPDSHQPSSDAPLESVALPPLIALQTTRFLLYRCNMSPGCEPSERAEALHRCTLIAQDTAKYISRVIHAPSGTSDPEGWRTKFVQIGSNMVCLHIWRCMLMLCFCGDFEAALMCLRLSAAIGTLRKINVACGKNLAFFLDRLLDRMRGGNGGHHQLEHDEEMLVYASGDLQGDREHSWVWTGGEPTVPPPMSPSSPHEQTRHSQEDAMQGIRTDANLALRPNPGSLENESAEWGGWAGIERSIQQLMEEHHARLSQSAQYYPPPHNPMKRVQLSSEAPASPTRPGVAPPTAPSGTSRISIANII
jgi:hypothetical protein